MNLFVGTIVGIHLNRIENTLIISIYYICSSIPALGTHKKQTGDGNPG